MQVYKKMQRTECFIDVTEIKCSFNFRKREEAKKALQNQVLKDGWDLETERTFLFQGNSLYQGMKDMMYARQQVVLKGNRETWLDIKIKKKDKKNRGCCYAPEIEASSELTFPKFQLWNILPYIWSLGFCSSSLSGELRRQQAQFLTYRRHSKSLLKVATKGLSSFTALKAYQCTFPQQQWASAQPLSTLFQQDLFIVVLRNT